MATIGDWLLEKECSCCGERLDCARFKGAGAAFLVATGALGGLGKLSESRTGVGFVMDNAGGLGGVRRGGGDRTGFTIDTFDGFGFLGLSRSGEPSVVWGSVRGVCMRSRRSSG
jgi:hypothetical protein